MHHFSPWLISEQSSCLGLWVGCNLQPPSIRYHQPGWFWNWNQQNLNTSPQHATTPFARIGEIFAIEITLLKPSPALVPTCEKQLSFARISCERPALMRLNYFCCGTFLASRVFVSSTWCKVKWGGWLRLGGLHNVTGYFFYTTPTGCLHNICSMPHKFAVFTPVSSGSETEHRSNRLCLFP